MLPTVTPFAGPLPRFKGLHAHPGTRSFNHGDQVHTSTHITALQQPGYVSQFKDSLPRTFIIALATKTSLPHIPIELWDAIFAFTAPSHFLVAKSIGNVLVDPPRKRAKSQLLGPQSAAILSPFWNIFEADHRLTQCPSCFTNHAAIVVVRLASTSLTWIPDNAFRDCTALRVVQLPHSLRSIGARAFHGCTRLKQPIALPNVQIVGDSAFSHTAITAVNLPQLTIVPNYFCDTCPALKTVVLPAARVSGHRMFAECPALTTVNLAAIVIDKGAVFSNCSNLKSVTIGGIVAVDISLFQNCAALPPSLPLDNITNYGPAAFYSASCAPEALTGFLTRIGISAFTASNVNSINVSLLDSIGAKAFSNCKFLTTLTVHFQTQQEDLCGTYAFAQSALKTVHITAPQSTSIGALTFKACRSLTSVYLNGPSIGRDAFADCVALQSVTVDTLHATVDRNAFANCVALKEITFKAVTVEWGAFINCTVLSLITADSFNAIRCDRKFHFPISVPPYRCPPPITGPLWIGARGGATFKVRSPSSDWWTQPAPPSDNPFFVPEMYTLFKTECLPPSEDLIKAFKHTFPHADNLALETVLAYHALPYAKSKNEAILNDYFKPFHTAPDLLQHIVYELNTIISAGRLDYPFTIRVDPPRVFFT